MINNNVKAITFLELIIVIIIAAILTMIALPSYHRFMAKREYQTVLKETQAAIQHGKAQSRIYKTNTVICPSSTGNECQNNQWNSGFLIFQDSNKDRRVNTNETIFTHTQLNLKYGQLRWNGTLAIPSITFNSTDGLPIGSNGSFYYCQTNTKDNFRLILSKMGHTRLEFPTSC